MAETIGHVYLKLAQMVIVTFIVIILLYRKRQHKIRALNWLIAVFVLADLQGLAELLIYFYKVHVVKLDDPSLFRFNEFHSLIYALALLVLFFMTEYMRMLRPNHWRVGLVGILWGGYFALLLKDAFGGFNWEFTKENLVMETPPQTHSFDLWFNLFQLVLIGFVAETFWKAYATSHSKENKRVSLWLFISVFVFGLVALEETLEGFFGVLFGGTFGYKAIYYSLTFLVLAYVYVKYPYYVFNVPTYVYRIILSTTNGVFIYGAEIDNPFVKEGEEEIVSDELLAGALSAMTQFMEEAAYGRGTIRLVELEDRALLVRKEGNLVGMVIAEKATRMLHSALGQFVREFNETFAETIETYWEAEAFVGSEYIIARCFPFVEAKDIIRTRIGSKTK